MDTRRRMLAALAAAPWVTSKARSPRPKVLGALNPFPKADSEAGLRRWMKKFGYAEAATQTIVALHSDGHDERLPKLAADLVALRPDVIVTWGDVAARAVQAATSSIPIVVMTDNLAAVGRVDSLNRPGGNMTGISVMATDLDAKRLELLGALLPPNSAVMLLTDTHTLPLSRSALTRTGKALGLRLNDAPVRSPEQIRTAIAGARSQGIGGINVLASPFLFTWSDETIKWANDARLPAIFEWGFLVDFGALIAYGPQLDPLYRRMLDQVMGLLRGGRVADFPVEQPSVFELAINLKTARTIGVTVPQSLLVRADRVVRDQ